MPQKDILAAAYLKDKSRLADLLNACVFGGEQFIRPEDIREADCTEYPFERSGKSHKTQKGYRDLIQIVACGIQFFILGVENQSYVDCTKSLARLLAPDTCFHYFFQKK